MNFLIILLFFNNIKSVKLKSTENDGVYRYNANTTQKVPMPQKLQNETDLNYNIRNYKELSSLPSILLESFISEMRKIPYDSIFDIENNDREIIQYELTNQKNLISIKKIDNPNLYNPINTHTLINTNINVTVLALSYMNEIESFLVKHAASNSECPNSNFYIYDNHCLAINSIDSSYYIFAKNNINLMKNIEGISSLFEEETITCYERCKNFSRDWIPSVNAFILLFSGIVVPLVGKKIKQE